MRGGQRGAVLLELALVVPVIFFLLTGGATLAYMATAKASLQMTAMRAGRELADLEVIDQLQQEKHLYRYEEFTETYGLPRPKVKMTVAREGGVILVGACYRVRLPLPEFGRKEPAPLPGIAQPVADLTLPPTTVRQLQELRDAAQDAADSADEVWQQAAAVWKGLSRLSTSNKSFDQFVDLETGYDDLTGFDNATKRLCGTRNILLSARSAFWSENHAAGSTLQLTLDPPEVTIYAGTNLDTLPQTTATVTTTPASTTCVIEVMYKSGVSQAQGLKQDASTTQGDSAVHSWTWNVGSNTSRGDWPVTVRCDNGRSATVNLKVNRSAMTQPVGG